MIKIAVALFCLVSPLQAQQKPLDAIYSYRSKTSQMSVCHVDGYQFWSERKGKAELCLVISDSSSTSYNYGVCGVLCGALIEGLATKPSTKEVRLSAREDCIVSFVDNANSVVIQIGNKRVSMEHAEATKLVRILMNHWIISADPQSED